MRSFRHALAALCALVIPCAGSGDEFTVEAPVVIRNITIVAAPGRQIEGGVIVMERGRFSAVGTGAETPAGARIFDGKGLVAYAGFIDGFSRAGIREPRVELADEIRFESDFPSMSEGLRIATVDANRAGIFAHRRAVELVDLAHADVGKSREAGFTAALLAPPEAIFGGQASVVSLGERPLRESVLRADFLQTASFARPPRRNDRDRGSYPGTLLGVIAHARQTFSDARWHREMTTYVGRHPEARDRLPIDADLEVLGDVLEGRQPLIWAADGADEIERALAVAGEFGVKPIILGGRESYKRIDLLRQQGISLIQRIDLAAKPREYRFDAVKIRKAEDDETLYGKNWEDRPFYPKAAYDEVTRQRDEQRAGLAEIEKAGLIWCITGIGHRRPNALLANLREFIEGGLPVDAAVKALTVSPAKLLGLEKELGTVEVGKRANLTVLTKPLDDKKARVRWVFIDGCPYEFDAASADRRGDRGAAGARGGRRGEEPPERREPRDPPEVEEASEAATEEEEDADEEPPASSRPVATTASRPAPPPGPLDDFLLHEPSWPIETEMTRKPALRTGGSVLLRNATVIPISGPAMPGASILVRDGKIAQIGAGIAAPAGVQAIDLSGYCVMPGIIDPHAHIALDGINEFSLSVTPEVRVGDTVRHDSRRIFDAITGGCTTIHAMHGSANTIGGQNVQLKLKYGLPARELLVPDQVRTVKFATGENVKRSGIRRRDFGGPPQIQRFPGTRMGVEATMRRALQAGKHYDERRRSAAADQSAGRDAEPLRRDLRLEALADIISGDLWINAHCYRADEILRLLAVAEDFGVRVAALHHVLEGYRIMPEIARHGSGTATFADWWAYKVESYDAVPHNAGMLLRAGVNSTLKSDSADLMRHMTVEAAKSMKYSGITSDEALRLITLNAAKMFALDKRLGSIEAGKEADLAIFDGHPLDTFSRCVMTLIEGEVFFVHSEFDPAAPQQAKRPPKQFRQDSMKAQAQADWDPIAGVAGASVREAFGKPGVYAILNATIHPVSGPVIERGVLVISGERIASIGANAAIPADAHRIDAAGLHVWPGLINAASQVGMQEIEAVDVTIDTAESGTYQPDVTAASAFNPQSRMIEVTRAEGILTTLLYASGPTIAGQASLVHLNGWTMPEMLHDAAFGLVVNLPSERPKPIVPDEPEPEIDEPPRRPERSETSKALKRIERFFRDARLYADAAAARDRGEKTQIRFDPRFEAMIPYIRGEKPVLFRVDSYKGILEVLLFAEQIKIKPILVGAREAWKLADLLASKQVPVIYEGVFAMPDAADPWDCNYRAAGVLAAAGVKFCFGHREADLAKIMPTEAGFAVAHGLDADAAVRAMTLSAAEILGVADQLGSLETGKLANVLITTDHPGQASGKVTHAFIRGVPMPLESQHTRSAQMFNERPAPALPAPRTDLRGSKPQSGH